MASKLRIAFLTHEPFYPPSGGGSAEAIYLVQEMVRRGHEVHVFCPRIADAEDVENKFGIRLHPFNRWQMSRYVRFRNFKYLAYPFFLERMVTRAARETKFDLLVSQHAISAVAAGRLKRKLAVPVVMNFPDLLTGFMETWRTWLAPRPLVEALKRFEISLPSRFGVDGVMTVSDTLADLFAERGFPREKILPIYYGFDADKFPFRAQLLPGNKPPVVVMHGSFDAHHLGQIAFDAMRFVTRQRPEIVFRFVGKKTATLEGFLNRAQKHIPGFKFEATGFVPYAEVARISPMRASASCLTRNPPGRTARLSPRSSNMSPAGCPPWRRRSKASSAILRMTRWCASRNSRAKILGNKSSAGSMNPRKPGRSAPQNPPRASRSNWIGVRSVAEAVNFVEKICSTAKTQSSPS